MIFSTLVHFTSFIINCNVHSAISVKKRLKITELLLRCSIVRFQLCSPLIKLNCKNTSGTH